MGEQWWGIQGTSSPVPTTTTTTTAHGSVGDLPAGPGPFVLKSSPASGPETGGKQSSVPHSEGARWPACFTRSRVMPCCMG